MLVSIPILSPPWLFLISTSFISETSPAMTSHKLSSIPHTSHHWGHCHHIFLPYLQLSSLPHEPCGKSHTWFSLPPYTAEIVLCICGQTFFLVIMSVMLSGRRSQAEDLRGWTPNHSPSVSPPPCFSAKVGEVPEVFWQWQGNFGLVEFEFCFGLKDET